MSAYDRADLQNQGVSGKPHAVERERIELHAANCPACDAERTLARGFDEATDGSGIDAADIDDVAARLARFRSRKRVLPSWGLAAAAVAGAASAVFRRLAGPVTAEWSAASTVEHAEVTSLARVTGSVSAEWRASSAVGRTADRSVPHRARNQASCATRGATALRNRALAPRSRARAG